MATKPAAAERPTVSDTLTQITDLILNYRYPTRTPSLADVVRTVTAASHTLRYANREEKQSIANSVTMSVARAKGLVS